MRLIRSRLILMFTALASGTTALIAIAFYLLAGAGVSLVVTIGWLFLAVLATAWVTGSRLDEERNARADATGRRLDGLAARTEERWASVQDLAHELRNPLAVMATTLDVALGDVDATVVELRRSAGVVRRTVDRAAGTVDDLIIFARNETPEAKRTEIDLYRLLAEVVAEHQGPIAAQRLAVERLGGAASVVGDRDALKRALGNIVGNAVRLSRPHSVLRVGAGSHGGFGWVGADDQGPGLDPKEHAQVFQRFWTHDRASLGGEQRTGLGLAITRQIAEQHGGLVTLRSEFGAGAEFVIWIPQSPDADPTAITADGVHPVWSPLQDSAKGSQRDTRRRQPTESISLPAQGW
jgi:signal transduction histidine kinase